MNAADKPSSRGVHPASANIRDTRDTRDTRGTRGNREIREIMAISPVIPVLTIQRLDQAVPLAEALVRGGLRVLEVTLRTPCALEAIRAMRAAVADAIVGGGTLTRVRDFSDCAAAGAQFGVTPGLTTELIAAATHNRACRCCPAS
jgi:Entner-Doudoroff aldolase